MLEAQAIPQPGTSVVVLGVLSAVVYISWFVFRTLAERSTTWRLEVSLDEWARDRGFRRDRCAENLPAPMDRLRKGEVSARLCLSSKAETLLQCDPVRGPGGAWHVLIRRNKSAWPPTALRPTHAARNVVDLFSLSSYPLLGPTDRFTVYGVDSEAAHALSRSAARGLLPPDVGLLLAGDRLLLDFSARPFDEIEFNRMRALADQLQNHLARGA